MTDLERDLREMMHQKAQDGHSVPRRTSQLARRARVNRAATVLVGAMAIVALLVGGFGAARSLSRNQTLPPAKLIPEQEGPKGDWIAYSTAHAGDELLRPRCSGFASGCERPLEGSDIFLVHEGQERQEPRLVAGRGEDGEKWNMCPAFSPDGTMLAFGTKSPAGRGLRVVGVSRTGEITSPNIDLEVPGEGRAPCPRWSSDGSRLAYLHRGTVIVRALDGSSPPAAQGDPVVADFRRGRALIRGVVSPSGELIARTRHRMGVVVSRPDGSDRRELGPRALEPGMVLDNGSVVRYPYAVAGWSPDERKIILMFDTGTGFGMSVVTVHAPYDSVTLVEYVPVNHARSWPEYGDVSWQPS